MGGQSGCERRIEVFVKIQKKKFGGGGGGGGPVGGGSVAEGVRWGGGVGWAGVRVDVNAMLGVGVMWGMGEGCEPRIEGIVQCTKRYCTIFRNEKMWGGGEVEGAIFEPKTLSMYLKKEKEKKKVKKKKI